MIMTNLKGTIQQVTFFDYSWKLKKGKIKCNMTKASRKVERFLK